MIDHLARPGHIPALVHPVKYRADIDGLRAISVVAVILFHMSPRRFPAGGIGVDVFLVISGYLIGGIILASREQGRFSFAEFYLRRVRRIFPAFAVMLLVCSLAATLLLFPRPLVAMAESGLGAIVCAANFVFFARANYFGPDSTTMPFLHTWTLGVEEQFYFVFPFVALACFGWLPRRAITPVLAALSAASLMLSQYQLAHAPAAAFYLLPSRAWELLAGVLVTRLPPRPALPRPVREGLAAAGLALVLGSLLLIDPTRGFPGLKAVPPCLGAALLLAGGQAGGSLVQRLLSALPMRLVGRASYSLYLWHWPIIVLFMAWRVTARLTVVSAPAILLASFVAGFASWRWIERPFRDRRLPARKLLAVCGALALATAAVEGAIVAGDGWPQRIPPRALAIAQYEGIQPRFTFPAAHCFLIAEQPVASFDRARCLAIRPGRPNWLLVGDSHAAMLYGALRRTFPDTNLLAAISFGCDVRIDTRADGSTCGDLMNEVFARFLPTAKLDGVILTSRWTVVDAGTLIALARALHARGIRLVVLGPAPEFNIPVARVLAEAERHRDPALPGRLLDPRLRYVDGQLAAIARGTPIEYRSVMGAMCPQAPRCLLTNPRGLPLYFDETHYTDEGATLLLARLGARGPGGAMFAPRQ